jgi:ribosomal protein S18 acetylase RimI-like enzyme
MAQVEPLTFTVRAATTEDRSVVEEFGAALQEFERTMRPSRCPGLERNRDYVETLFLRVTHQNGAIFLVETEHRPVGYLACYLDEDVFELLRAELVVSDVWVGPEMRSRGVLKALICATQEHARALGVSRMVVSTLFQNEEACAAYESLGFRRSLVTFECDVESKDGSRSETA